MPRAIVIGAGVSGLAAAHRLRELEPHCDVELVEAAAVPGGWLRTEVRDGFLIELGPDSILTEKPAAVALARRLGIEDRLVRTVPQRRGAYLVSRGRLVRVPRGFSMVAPAELRSFLRADALGATGKIRAMLEPWLPPRRGAGDESLGQFVRRRLGTEVFERLAQPLVAGIYGADADTLSLEATMPRFVAMEREHGSVVRALWANARSGERAGEPATGARYGLFVAFDRGMQVLIDALVAAVGAERIRLRAPAVAVARTERGYRVELEEGAALEAERVIVAVGAPRAAELLRAGGIDPAIADGLDAIPHGSAATVTLVWREKDVVHPLDAYGFVVPAVERREVLAATWSSAKWPGRAPEGWVLLRVFVGGVHAPDAAELDDALLISLCRRELRALMGIEAPPAFVRVVRYPRAMPLYTVGHRARAEAIEARLAALPGLALAGTALHGVGVPDAIAAGERAAERIARRG